MDEWYSVKQIKERAMEDALNPHICLRMAKYPYSRQDYNEIWEREYNRIQRSITAATRGIVNSVSRRRK